MGYGNGQFRDPRDITVDGAGNVYVIQSNTDKIQQFDASGNFIRRVGPAFLGSGGISDRMLEAYGLAIDSNGMIYAADTGNHRILVFDSLFNYVTEWGGYGSLDVTVHPL